MNLEILQNKKQECRTWKNVEPWFLQLQEASKIEKSNLEIDYGDWFSVGKKEDLTSEEFEIMKNHAVIGFDALKNASADQGTDYFLSMAMDIILYHHERWDGNGYPEGLKGENIPLTARIVSICDVYDALTSRRPYKEAYPHDKAIDIMKGEVGKFDPVLFNLFIKNAEEFNKIRTKYSEQETGEA